MYGTGQPNTSTDPAQYSVVGTTLSMVKANDFQLPSVIEATIAGQAVDLQPNLWVIGQNSSNLSSIASFYSSSGDNPISEEDAQDQGYNNISAPPASQTAFQAKPFFTSSLTFGTDTGILRALALRMSTSLQCQDVKHTEFPSDCNETASFAANFSNTQFREEADASPSNTSYIAPMFSFQICSPAATNWSRGTNSSQTIREELYIDLQTWRSAATDDSWGLASQVPIRFNFTYHCIADSQLAYFEPMNEWNRHQVQDMIDVKAEDFPHFTGPNVRSATQDLTFSPAAPGLATSVHALFGNNTFFNSIVNANDTRGANLDVCRALRMPLTGLCDDHLMCNPYTAESGSTLRCDRPSDSSSPGPTEDEYPEDYGLSNATASSGTLAYFLYMWLQRFNNWNSTMAALTLTNFYSAKAILDPSRANALPIGTLDDAEDPSETPYALPISSSPGLPIQKLHIPLGAIIAISLLIFLQLMGLLLLGVYTSTQRTWTASLDGFALLRMGKAMKETLPLQLV